MCSLIFFDYAPESRIHGDGPPGTRIDPYVHCDIIPDNSFCSGILQNSFESKTGIPDVHNPCEYIQEIVEMSRFLVV